MPKGSLPGARSARRALQPVARHVFALSQHAKSSLGINRKIKTHESWATGGRMDRDVECARIVASTASPAFAIDEAGRIAAWNPGAEQFFGFGAANVVGRFCWDTVGGLDPYLNLYCGPHCALLEMARQRRAIHACELLFRNAEGKRRRAHVSSFIVAGRSPAEMVIVHFLQLAPHDATGENYRLNGDGTETGNPLLTERQLQVLRLMAHGHTTREIARELRISVGTVRNHCGKILQALQAHTRLQAVDAARALHMLG